MSEFVLSLLWVATMHALQRAALARDVQHYNVLANHARPLCGVLGWPEWGPAMRGAT